MSKEQFEKIKSIKDIKEIFINLFPIFFQTKKTINILASCFYRVETKFAKNKYKQFIQINDDNYPIKGLFGKGLFGIRKGKYKYYFNIYKCSIPKTNLLEYNPQNLIKACMKSKDEEVVMPTIYNLIHFKKCKGLVSKVYKIPNSDLVCFFRQAKMNSFALTVREPNVTDSLKYREMISCAKLLSQLTPKKDIILLYEKELDKYEESSSVVYERLIDEGYTNCYYIIKKTSKHNEFIKDKYKKNIIYAYTFKHFYYFFKCHKFVATETVPHAVELRAANKYITRKLLKKDYQQVFLQHGVMYMVALDSAMRGGFRKNGDELPKFIRIVVSSKLEQQHFVDLGGFNPEELYVTGLPFYDRTIKNKDADKITIMPTWRSWDYNTLVSNYKDASYYQFCKSIIDNIPDKYKDKIYLLPHPLILKKFKDTDLNKWIPDIISYDKILEETNLLITDYSSISYSAFYRGSNVIFCWEELDKCMEHYETHLMLNKDNAFGDIAFKNTDIGKLVEKNYNTPQTKEYIDKYSKIVEFHDGKNTDRVIECLKRDNII